MDPNLNNEARNRLREEALARRLGEALDRAAPRGTEPCPDAEVIAAYHERALAPDEIGQCESHFAACSRCRKILAVLAASDETPLAEKEVARLGELVAAARWPADKTSQTAKPARPNLLDWRARWLAPALGVAAVLAVWFAVRPPWRTPDQSSSGALIAQAPKNEPAPNAESPVVDQFSRAAPAKRPETESAARSESLKDNSLPTIESQRPAADASAKNRLGDSKVGVAESAPGNQKNKETGTVGGAVGGLAQPPPAAAPTLSAPRAQAKVQEMSPPAPPELPAAANAPARSLMAPYEQGAAPRNAAGVGGGVAGSGGGSGGPFGMSIAAVLKSPSGAVSWRIGAGGRIERSIDANRAWTLQTSPSQQAWLAGSAVSDTTCWVVGRNGAIARTTDGEHWEQVTPPPMISGASGKLPDWIAITASDALTATITSSDQGRYVTHDGGKTWQSP
jgi:hypothetical protein